VVFHKRELAVVVGQIIASKVAVGSRAQILMFCRISILPMIKTTQSGAMSLTGLVRGIIASRWITSSNAVCRYIIENNRPRTNNYVVTNPYPSLDGTTGPNVDVLADMDFFGRFGAVPFSPVSRCLEGVDSNTSANPGVTSDSYSVATKELAVASYDDIFANNDVATVLAVKRRSSMPSFAEGDVS
jgi:hypothetical protein